VRYANALPANFTRGSIAFIAAGDEFRHNDVVTETWVKDRSRSCCAGSPASNREIAPPHGLVARKLAHRAREADMPFLENIGAVAHGLGEMKILLR
jgi:hypothetical protein